MVKKLPRVGKKVKQVFKEKKIKLREKGNKEMVVEVLSSQVVLSDTVYPTVGQHVCITSQGRGV